MRLLRLLRWRVPVRVGIQALEHVVRRGLPPVVALKALPNVRPCLSPCHLAFRRPLAASCNVPDS